MPDNNKLININITFRNTEATDPLREYVTEKLKNCLQKFVHRDTEAHVVLQVEKNRQIAEVTVYVDGLSINGKEESGDLYTATDALVGSLTQQLRKHKEKITRHH